MFVVVAHKIVVGKCGKAYLVDRKIIKKIPRESMRDKGYDISSRDFWGKQLARLQTSSGKLLPLHDKFGQKYVYEVLILGTMSSWMRPYFPQFEENRRGSICLFPAYDENNKKISTFLASIDRYR